VVFWITTLCSDVGYQHFKGPCCLHLQGEWRLRQHGPSNCWYPSTSLYDVITQKIMIWTLQPFNVSCWNFSCC
jgi:hypothetical protein